MPFDRVDANNVVLAPPSFDFEYLYRFLPALIYKFSIILNSHSISWQVSVIFQFFNEYQNSNFFLELFWQ
jgi:hypothetical protein